MSDSDEDDVHFCLRCKGTFIGLDTYIEHRKVKCKRDDSQSLTSLDLQCTKTSSANVNLGADKSDIPSGSDTSNRGNWTLEGLQNSSPLVKEDSRLEDILQPDILEMNRKDEILDTFLPSHDNDPCLNAADFFSILELQSSKTPNFQDIPLAPKVQSGMVTRSKASAVIQAKKNRDSFISKALTPDYDYEYQGEHSQYVVGRDVVITDDYDYRKDDSGSLKDRKSDLDSPKSKSRNEERILEDEGKSASEFLFQDVHNEVIISSEVREPEETDSSSEESDEDDYGDEYETRRIPTGGKWKPEGNEWGSNSYWSSAPPASHTGGKWKPAPPPQETSALDLPSTSLAHQRETISEPQNPMTVEDFEGTKSRAPPPDHTRGKWLPTPEPPASARFWCGPCHRQLSSQALYEKHCRSNLHRRRTRQESQLEEDMSLEHPRSKREGKKTQAYIDSDLWSKAKRKRLRQNATPDASCPNRGRGPLLCEVCQCRVWPHYLGKHLVSLYHALRARADPDLAGNLALKHMASIVRQAPFQCGPCRHYYNSEQAFLQHWASPEHAERDLQVEGRYCCLFCRVECATSHAMYQHLLSDRHKESVIIISGSVPMVIQKKLVIQCGTCHREFRHNIELRLHAKSAGHAQDSGTASDRYQERERCRQCPYLSFSKLSLQRHLALAHKDSEGRYFCTCCDLDFLSAADAKAHRASSEHQAAAVARRSGVDKEVAMAKVCCNCYGVFNGITELKKHLAEEHPDVSYRCMKCGSHFTLKQQLARHARLGCQGPQPTTSSTADTSEALLRCPSCPFTSTSEAELLFHVALHSDPLDTPGQPPRYRCPQCPRVFLKSSLKKHLHSHTGERPYSCSVCNAGFTRKDVLENHVVSVHGLKRAGLSWEVQPERKKTETCEECGTSFYDKTTLNQHRQIHSGKQFKCEEPNCLYAGRSRADLRAHLLIHGEDRPFQCEHCRFRTKTKAQLVRHGRRHLETKTHHCAHCKFECNSSTHLKRHLRLHTGAKPFHCPHCDFSCNLLENLRKHVLSTKKHPGMCLYSCREFGCTFSSNMARDFRLHLVTSHGQSAATAASFVAGLYRGGEDPQDVTLPLPAPFRRKKRKSPRDTHAAEDLAQQPKSLSTNPTLASAAADSGRSEDLLRTVIMSEPAADDVICIQGLDVFLQGDAAGALFEGLQRDRTVSLGESAVMMDYEDHGGLIVIDEGVEAEEEGKEDEEDQQQD